MKPCSDCPFLKSSPLIGDPSWLIDVVNKEEENPFFTHSCHKTDPKACGYKGAKKVIECRGRLTMMMNEFDRTPGKSGVYESTKEMVIAYVRHWKTTRFIR